MQILIVDNEKTVLSALKRQLSRLTKQIETAHTYELAKEKIFQKSFDVVVLDHQLSKETTDKQGLDLVREVRSRRNTTPIIVLTARDREEITSWDSLDSGADDFVKKPYMLNDLIARIKLAYRKSFQCNNNSTNILLHNDLELNIETRKLKINNVEHLLGEKDLLLLSKFLKYPYKLFSAEDLVEHLWENTTVYNKKSMNALRVCICSLKNILGKEKYIHNRYGYGYIFDETEEDKN